MPLCNIIGPFPATSLAWSHVLSSTHLCEATIIRILNTIIHDILSINLISIKL